jgi:hypothetical protein
MKFFDKIQEKNRMALKSAPPSCGNITLKIHSKQEKQKIRVISRRSGKAFCQ